MAKRKGLSISLAAKCQLLFGLAVLVIIAGALAVPWQRMEQLAKQPNIKAARFAADLVFRQVHVEEPAIHLPKNKKVESTTQLDAPETQKLQGEWARASLSDAAYGKPR